MTMDTRGVEEARRREEGARDEGARPDPRRPARLTELLLSIPAAVMFRAGA